MELSTPASQQSSMEQVEERFETWRRTRLKRCAVPDELWQVAESLYSEYSLYRISKALRLNYTDLEHRIKQKSSTVVTKNTYVPIFSVLCDASWMHNLSIGHIQLPAIHFCHRSTPTRRTRILLTNPQLTTNNLSHEIHANDSLPNLIPKDYLIGAKRITSGPTTNS